MAHGVELEIAERDLLHFAIGPVVVDPVLVAAEAVACVQNRRVLVGDPGQFTEPAARQSTQAIEMRLQPSKIIRLEIKPEQVAQAAVDRVEILSGAIRRDVIGAALLRAAERSAQWRCMHFGPLSPANWLGRRRPRLDSAWLHQPLNTA